MYFTRGFSQGVRKTLFNSEVLYIKFRAGLQLRDQSGGDSFIQISEVSYIKFWAGLQSG